MKTKKMFWAALSMTAAFVMTACSSDNDMTETPAAPQISKTIPYTVTVSDNTAISRATVKDDPTDRQLYFAEGDKLYITGTNIHGVLDLKAGDEGKNTDATFSGELTYTGSGSPADELALTATLVSAQQTVGTEISVDGVGAVTVNYPTTSYCANINDAVQQYSRLTGTSTYGARSFSLTQQSAFLNFVITFEDGTTAGETLEAVVSNNSSTICTADITTETENAKVIAKFVLPVASGTTLSGATVRIGDKNALNITNATLTGKIYNVKKTQDAVIVTDLSMVDCGGNARASMWTANCYMVHTAGYYKLPLVYGNAIKNGADNTVAYNPGRSTSNTYCSNFVNHADQAINAPWITKSISGEGVNKGMGITVTSAELLWQDATGLITAVGIDGDYLTLTVSKDAVTQEGNALIAVKDAEGTIVWSWHIWVTKQTFAAADLTTVATGDHNYIVTPVNLGWVGERVSQGYCTYYQWGRKEAFIPSSGASNDNHIVYNINGGTVTGLTYKSTTATIADNIKNPTTHYYNYSNQGPCKTMYYNMWDAKQTSTDNISTPTDKTIYDPCPAGFCVPTGNLYCYVGTRNDSNWDNTNNGKTWSMDITGNPIFFPASGRRVSDNGSFSDVGSIGYYWSASGNTGNGIYARDLNFFSSYWSSNNYSRANGFPVRAVAEE